MRTIVYSFILLCTLFFSCKSDSATDPEFQTIEEGYFEDYSSPREKWGYMDVTGETVIKPKFDDVRDMLGPITAANFKGRWGFIDQKGNTHIEFQYKQVQDFNQEADRAFVQDFNNKWLLINDKNEIIDSLPFDNFKQFVGNYCPVATGGDWGIIDRSGALVVPTTYGLIDLIKMDLAIAKKYGKQGIINMNNVPVLDFQFKKINYCENDFVRMRDDKGYCFYDLKTMSKASPYYQKASLLKDGYFVGKTDRQLAIITDQFKVFKSLPYDRVEYANQNRWVYKENGLWGILDEKGESLTEAKFDLINKYEEDIILFSQQELWGYLDMKGELFIPADFPIAWEYKNGYARILHRKGIGFIDKSKNLVIDRRVFEVRDFYNGLARFQTL